MSMDNIDLSQVNTGLYLNKEGRYLVRVESFKRGESEVKGTPFIEYKFKMDNGQIHEQRFYTNPNSLWKLKMLVEHANKEETHVTDFDPASILDKWVHIVCKETTFNGYDRLEIDSVEEGDAPAGDEDPKIINLKEKVGEKKDEPF